jgi:glutamate transport system permease protein
MASNVLIEELGPRAKQRVRVATMVSIVVLVAIAAWVLWTLAGQGQLDPAKWTEIFSSSNMRFLLWEGLILGTIRASIVAGALSVTFGFLLALARISRSAWLRSATLAYIEFFRALPLLLTIFMVYFGAPTLGLDLGIFWSVVIALTLYNSAVLSEIFRAGIRSLDKGQTEAAQAIGLPYWPMMRLIILPQAVRRMIPAIVAQMATLTKDVSLGFVIGYPEFVQRASRIESFSEEAGNFQAYVFAAVVYFFVIWALARFADYLNERQPTQSAAPVDAEDGDEEDPGEILDIAEQAAAG